MNTPHPLLAIEHLSFGYPQRPLFQDWSARVEPGVTLVRGGDGAGKTTLLRLLAGALAPQRGDLRLNGLRLADQPATWREQVFWVDPRADGCDGLTPGECLAQVAQRHRGFEPGLAADLVEGLTLTPHMGKRLDMLSTGSRRKVWLAAAFASGAALTLLDDPLAALDRPSVAFVTALLQEASAHPTRAWLVTGYEALADVALAGTLDLGG
ncbi:MAG: ATP-binding cassette domain-containing protein [Ramlibacter sp.]|nr:ATP-binding cassette domain-containing protein [Ramlibacter sp.]